MRQQIVGFSPKQLVLPFALWTRRAIKVLIVQKFGVELSDRLAGKYLKRWGFTPQRPELIEQWLKDTCSAIEAKAKAEGGHHLLWRRDGGQGRLCLDLRLCAKSKDTRA